MSHISIHNIGPIKDINIELNRINIFMGPQSSGKSTIAKIISFCQWLEKDCVVRQSTDHITNSFIYDNFIIYHNISSYIEDSSEFHYKGAALNIDFSKEKTNISKAAKFSSTPISKNAYIPSERNIAFIPRISSLDLTRNYLRSFLFDWLGIRTKFTKDDEIGIVDMGVKYYYNEAQKKDKLVIESNDCETEIDMEQASSGLMSITPLYAYLTYLTSWIYSHNEDRSYETDQKIKDGLRRRLAEKEINIPESVFDTYIRTHESQPITFDAKTESDNNPTSVIIQKLQAEFWRPKYSSIIIEEPEQNLFPDTQARLLYHIFAMINQNRDNLLITTHSPFILYALNNCMLAWNKSGAKENCNNLEFSYESFINPHNVAVWELRNGYIEDVNGKRNVTIQDESGLIRDNYFDRVMSNIMSDFYSLMGNK